MRSYSRIEPSALTQVNDHAVFQSVAEHVTAQVGDAWGLVALEQIEGVPEAVVAAWTLWWFAAGVGGNGLPDYFLNHCGSVSEAKAYYSALKAVGASELLEMFEACVPLTLEMGAEIGFLSEAEWFKSFSRNERWGDIEALEGPSMELAGDPLSCLVAAHVRAASDFV